MKLQNIAFGQNLTVNTIPKKGKESERVFEINTGLYPQCGSPTEFTILPYQKGKNPGISIHNEGEKSHDENGEIINRIDGVSKDQLQKAWNGIFDMMLSGKDAQVTVNQKQNQVDFVV